MSVPSLLLASQRVEISDFLDVVVFAVILLLPFAALFLSFADHHTSAIAALIAWLVMVGWVVANSIKNKREHRQREQDHLLKRKRDGVAFRSSDYAPVNADEWNLVCNRRHGLGIDWLEDQVQELQSGDIVLCDSYRASWSGYAVERDGKIVAIATIMLC